MESYQIKDCLDGYPKLQQFRDDIKTLFDSIRNFTIAFAAMHLITLSEGIFPSIYIDSFLRKMLVFCLFGTSIALTIMNIFWLYTNAKVHNIGRYRWISYAVFALVLLAVFYVWLGYFISHVWPILLNA